jgi:hypothetical protein
MRSEQGITTDCNAYIATQGLSLKAAGHEFLSLSAAYPHFTYVVKCYKHHCVLLYASTVILDSYNKHYLIDSSIEKSAYFNIYTSSIILLVSNTNDY